MALTITTQNLALIPHYHIFCVRKCLDSFLIVSGLILFYHLITFSVFLRFYLSCYVRNEVFYMADSGFFPQLHFLFCIQNLSGMSAYSLQVHLSKIQSEFISSWFDSIYITILCCLHVHLSTNLLLSKSGRSDKGKLGETASSFFKKRSPAIPRDTYPFMS